MILRPEQILLLRLGCPAIPANGGDSESDASTTSNTSNTNFVTTEDRRVVASDAAIALSGNGNVASRTDNNTTTFTDTSNRSTNFSDSSNHSVSFADSSNRSTSFTDSSQRDSGNTTSISNTTTDFGSVSAALEGVTTMGTRALDVTDSSVQGAIDVLKQMSDNNLTMTQRAFELARNVSADSVRTTQATTSFASAQTQMTNDAFAQAEFGPDMSKTLMWVTLAAVGAIVAVGVFKKG